MKPFNIFVSWSGPTSYKIANTLEKLLDDFFEKEVECWISKKDIPPGVGWYEAITDAVCKADFGIICLIPENLDSQWLQFEGGALVSSILAKEKHSSSVCSYLFGVETNNIPEPLSPLQGVSADYEGTKKLFERINSLLERPKIESKKQFDILFDDSWKRLGSKFPTACPSDAPIGLLKEINSSSRRFSSKLKGPVNPYAEFLLVKALKKFYDDFSVENSIATFKAPASTYPNHLLLLLEKFGHPVKAIALVDDKEHFWQGSIGADVIRNTPGTSQRVFVFKDREHLEKNIDLVIRHAHKYRVYAISWPELFKRFEAYAHDFSIIGTQETKILAKYDPNEKIESISFTTDPKVILSYEDAFDQIISKSTEMAVDSTKEINEAQKKKFIDEVFKKSEKTNLPHESIEMSAYVSVPQYAQFEEDHAYFIDMMTKMLDHFKEKRYVTKRCRVLELGAGTGHFTKRLILSGNVSVTAVEIDWACYHYLRGALETNPVLSDTPNYELRVVFADSCNFVDPDDKRFDFIFSSFADHHIKPADKKLYFENIKKNLSPNGVFIVGDEFIPSYDPEEDGSFESAVKRYHNHIIDIARKEGHDELVELETAAMKSGLEKRGDFKMPCEEFEKYLYEADLRFTKEIIGPKDRNDVGGIYVYVIGKAE
jgi:SAM-dependent methyltransferase